MDNSNKSHESECNLISIKEYFLNRALFFLSFSDKKLFLMICFVNARKRQSRSICEYKRKKKRCKRTNNLFPSTIFSKWLKLSDTINTFLQLFTLSVVFFQNENQVNMTFSSPVRDRSTLRSNAKLTGNAKNTVFGYTLLSTYVKKL